MSIGFLVWFILSAILLFFLGWNIVLSTRQRRAWKSYAKAHGLEYRGVGLVGAAEMKGFIDEREVNFFPASYEQDGGRRVRNLTAIEMTLDGDIPFGGAVALGEAAVLAEALGLTADMVIIDGDFPKTCSVLSDDEAAMRAYLTAERKEALLGLMKIKHAQVIVAFRYGVFVLRVDTPKPLDEVKTLEGYLKRMGAVAKVLEPSADEVERMDAAAAV